MNDPLVDTNKRLEMEIAIVQEMFHGERWNAQCTVTHQSGLMIMLMGAENVDEVLLGLSVFAKTAAEDGDPIVLACLTVDTYHLSMSIKGFEDGGRPVLRKGELQERFEAGDRDVKEAMNIMIVTPTDEAMAFLPYQRLAKGIRWQPMIREGMPEGRVLDAMREALR